MFRGRTEGGGSEGSRWTREDTDLRGLQVQAPAAHAEEKIWGQLAGSWPALQVREQLPEPPTHCVCTHICIPPADLTPNRLKRKARTELSALLVSV